MFVRILAAGLAGAVTFFLGGWVIYGMLLRSYMDSTMSAAAKTVTNTEPAMLPLFIAQLAFGFLFAFIFEYWASIRTFVGGLRGGAILFFFFALGFDMQMNAFFKDMYVGSPYVPIIVDVIAATCLGAIAGGVVGLVLGMMNKGEAAG